MTKRKGFTLVELIAVIVIISLIAIIALPNIFNSEEAVKKEAVVLFASKVKDAADGAFTNELVREHASDIEWYTLSELGMSEEEYQGYVRIDRCSSEKSIKVYIWNDEYKFLHQILIQKMLK